MLLLDQHKAQKTPSVLTMLNDECNTITALVPLGCTSLVQPLDVVFNGSFKQAVDTIATSHKEAHVNDYLHGNFTASECRILLTKWIGQAWEEVSANKDTVVSGLKKCGISVAIDGSEDNEINIKGFEDYQIVSDDDNPFATSGDSDSSTDSNSSGSVLSSGDEIEEVGLSSGDEEDCGSDVSFTVQFNSITNEECLLSPTKDLDDWVELEDVVENHFIV